ncbi:MAG TPA: GHKL domain-containing protein [Candidatus Coprenecus stercorigallinarum]|nr:GHKL domain-containing protein [Candidatus Coprenecus stercorigallinarum]
MNEDSYQELARLREQIAKQEKMASLGMLTAGIAHEIQNPLNFVINFSKMSGKLLEDLEDILSEGSISLSEDDREELTEIMEDLKENVRRIAENGDRASSIIRNILLYSRGKEDEYLPTDLCRLTKEYVSLSYHAMRANHKNFNVTFEEDYDETLPQVSVIPQDFSRAVLNIMNNACYAVFAKSRGATGCGYNPTIRISLHKDGDSARLVIEDNGTGISPDIRKHLFTPFFTTKPVGEGTGLGLSITKSIIEQKHHGTIKVESEPGQYSRFTISIPLNPKK